MNREQERAKRRPEKNPVVEYNKIQNKYYPELFAKFAEVNDPRNQSYIEYPVRVMLWNHVLQMHKRNFKYAGNDTEI